MGAAAQRRGAASRPQPSPGRDQGAPKAHGPVAQLVEQRVYTAAVVGSNPAGSTTGLLDGPLSRAVRVSASGSRAALRARGGGRLRAPPLGESVDLVPEVLRWQQARPRGSRFGDVTSAHIVPGGLARIERRRIPSR